MTTTCHRCAAALTEGARFCLKCGAMVEVIADAAEDPLVGKIIVGRYRILRMIGEGGMGRVYLAEQKMGASTRKIAIKTLHPELGSDPQLVARFHREAGTVAELSHPNTIQFYDFGELEDKSLYIVMEYIEGESLAKLLSRGPVDPVRVDRILAQICGSLYEAHQRGVVHRDLKPDNVLLTERGGQRDFVKVLDFGIAKRSEAEDAASAKLTKQGMVLGTPPYMSPEQFSGQSLDARSDIYSLATMTYEMLLGRLPFEAKTPWEWATKHLTATPERVDMHPLGARLPPQKSAAIMRALEKDRDRRQSDVLEYLREVTGQDANGNPTWARTPMGSQNMSQGNMSQGNMPGYPATGPQQGYGQQHTGGSPYQVGYQSGGQQMAGPHTGPQTGQQTGGQQGYGQQQYASGQAQQYGSGQQPQQAYATPHAQQQAYGQQGAYPTPGNMQSQPGMYGQHTPGGGNPYAVHTPAPVSASYSQHTPVATNKRGPIMAIIAVLGVFVLGGVAIFVYKLLQDDPSTVADLVVDAGGPVVAITQPHVDEVIAQVNPQVVDASVYVAAIDPQNNHNTDPPTNQDTPNNTAQSGNDNDPPPNRGTSPEDVARAQTFVATGRQLLAAGQLEPAIGALASAQRLVGRGHSSVAGLKNEVARYATNVVGNMMLRPDGCNPAKALYRKLRAVGAHTGAAVHFQGDYCRAP